MRFFPLFAPGVFLACASTPPPAPPALADQRRVEPPTEVVPFGATDFAADRPRSGPPPSHPVAPPGDHGKCIRGRMCQLEGLCSLDDGTDQCIAASSDDCRPSDACLGGRCTARHGTCIAASDDDCRGSWACKGYGLCSHDGAEACMATSEADCRASTRCARIGECQLDAGACVPGSGLGGSSLGGKDVGGKDVGGKDVGGKDVGGNGAGGKGAGGPAAPAQRDASTLR